MSKRPARVLIVDDSSTIRQLLKWKLRSDSRISVVGEASDALEARRLIKALNPDVLTLDIEMPGMNGIDFLQKIMTLRPMPVIMVSSETQLGSDAAIEALSIGAVECIGKPKLGSIARSLDVLPDLVCAAADARLRPNAPVVRQKPVAEFSWNGKIILIGASTGGVEALQIMVAQFPANCPPTIIAQHMPESFLKSFAKRLSSHTAARVVIAEDGMALEQGTIYLAPGGDTHLIIEPSDVMRCRLVFQDTPGGSRPSINVLFSSAFPVAQKVVAVLLSGMGRDGVLSMARLRKLGAACVAQDRDSSVVFGMPRGAIDAGAAEYVEPIDEMADKLMALCSVQR